MTDTASLTAAHDQRLAALLVSRDETALTDVFDRYSDLVYGITLQVLRNRPLAEETTRGVFLHLWENPGEYDPSCGSLRSHLVLLAQRHCGVLVRSGTAGNRGAGGFEDSTSTATTSPVAEVVLESLDRLPEAERRVVELTCFEGPDIGYVAESLGISVETAASRLGLGLRRLSELLAERGLTSWP